MALKRIIYEDTKKTAVSSGIDSQASLPGTVRDQRYRSCEGAETVEKDGIKNIE
jgi:hypothetical protein